MTRRVTFLISLCLGAIAATLVLARDHRRESRLLEQAELRPVVVARQDIARYAVIDPRALTVARVPAKYVQPRAVSDPAAVAGRVAGVPIPSGAQLQTTSIAEGRGADLAFAVPRGRRALTIGTTDVTGVSGLIEPGDFVDVFGTFEFGRPVGSSGGRVQYADERTETMALLQRAQIVAVGQSHLLDRQEPLNDEEGSGPSGTASRRPASAGQVRTVTLLVAPDEAPRLILAGQLGMLTLTLRSSLDAGEPDLATLDEFALLKMKVPLKRPSRVFSEFRGNERP